MSERVDYQLKRETAKHNVGFVDKVFSALLGSFNPVNVAAALYGPAEGREPTDEDIDKRDDVPVDEYNFGSKYSFEEKVLTGFIVDDFDKAVDANPDLKNGLIELSPYYTQRRDEYAKAPDNEKWRFSGDFSNIVSKELQSFQMGQRSEIVENAIKFSVICRMQQVCALADSSEVQSSIKACEVLKNNLSGLPEEAKLGVLGKQVFSPNLSKMEQALTQYITSHNHHKLSLAYLEETGLQGAEKEQEMAKINKKFFCDATEIHRTITEAEGRNPYDVKDFGTKRFLAESTKVASIFLIPGCVGTKVATKVASAVAIASGYVALDVDKRIDNLYFDEADLNRGALNSKAFIPASVVEKDIAENGRNSSFMMTRKFNEVISNSPDYPEVFQFLSDEEAKQMAAKNSNLAVADRAAQIKFPYRIEGASLSSLPTEVGKANIKERGK